MWVDRGLTPKASELERKAGLDGPKPGDVLRYAPIGGHHARQGTAVVRADGCIIDTFWGPAGDSESHHLRPAELENAELLFNLSEYRKLGEHYDNKLQEWLKYAPADRARIGSQGQWQSTYYVRIGAEPDLPTQIANARERLADAESEVRAAKRTVEWRREDLAKLEADQSGDES